MAADAVEVTHRELDVDGRLASVSATHFTDFDGWRSGTEPNPRLEATLENIATWSRTDTPVVMVDTSPDSRFADEFAEYGAVVLRPLRPAGESNQETQYIDGIAKVIGEGAVKVVRQEGDKRTMGLFKAKIDEALDEFDMLVIGRSDEAMATLPSTQARTERLTGFILQQLFGFPYDTLSGGRGYTQAGARVLTEDYEIVDKKLPWMHLYGPILMARLKGLSVGGIVVDLKHPEDIVYEEEEINPFFFDGKRADQAFGQMEHLFRMLLGYQPGEESRLSFSRGFKPDELREAYDAARKLQVAKEMNR